MSWSASQRLTFIETRLFWEGRLNRKDLVDFFRISVPQASNDIKRYDELAPGNMVYDRSQKVYLPGKSFKPKLISTEPQEYFRQLQQSEHDQGNSPIFWDIKPDFYLLPFPQRAVQPEHLKRVLVAIKNNLALEIKYQSLTDPDPHWRWITPHAFGYDGLRWHLRCFCHKRKTFRDFTLGRFLDVGEEREHEINRGDDRPWEGRVTFKIELHQLLSDAQKAAVALEFQMTGQQRIFEVRAAFAYYVIRYLQFYGALDHYDPAYNPEPAKPLSFYERPVEQRYRQKLLRLTNLAEIEGEVRRLEENE